MPMIGQKASASRHGGERPQSRPAGDQEHDQELILDGVDRFDACKDLTGHHPRQRDKADRSHAVHDWREAASQCVPQDRQQRLIPGTAKSKASFDGGSFAHQCIRQHVQAQAYSLMVLPRIMPNNGSA